MCVPRHEAANRAMKPSVRWLAALGLSLILGGLTACSSLPVLTPEMSIINATVRLQGARGPLTPQQSKAILSKLDSNGKPTGIFEQHLALEQEILGSSLVVGNKR